MVQGQVVDRSPGVYILKFSSGCVYVGASMHLGRRVDQHLKNLRRGSHPMSFLQAEWDRCGGGRGIDPVQVERLELPIEDGFELQVIERVMIRRMVQKKGRANVLNRSWSPTNVEKSPADLSPPELHPYS
jgi:hypothetical protein